jgi:hypothetical protein
VGLKETDVLIIGEISMVENHHFQRMNECLKSARCWSQQHNDYSPTLRHLAAFNFLSLVISVNYLQSSLSNTACFVAHLRFRMMITPELSGIVTAGLTAGHFMSRTGRPSGALPGKKLI